MTRFERIAQEIADQEKWIEKHGGNLVGYVERYGSKHDPEHFGDGGEAIYKADVNELMRLREQDLRVARWRKRKKRSMSPKKKKAHKGPTVLRRLANYLDENPDAAGNFWHSFDDLLDDMLAEDAFGTEGQHDPRGDRR